MTQIKTIGTIKLFNDFEDAIKARDLPLVCAHYNTVREARFPYPFMREVVTVILRNVVAAGWTEAIQGIHDMAPSIKPDVKVVLEASVETPYKQTVDVLKALISAYELAEVSHDEVVGTISVHMEQHNVAALEVIFSVVDQATIDKLTCRVVESYLSYSGSHKEITWMLKLLLQHGGQIQPRDIKAVMKYIKLQGDRELDKLLVASQVAQELTLTFGGE